MIINFILLSGGSGKRLWPLSNDIRSKQFIKIFRTTNGYESMVQRVYRQICEVNKDAIVTIATSKQQVSTIRNQLGNNVSISVEPCRRDTFPAIILAAAFLHDAKGVNENEIVIVCPVDPYVEIGYFQTLRILERQAKVSDANIVLMGIEPTYPSEKYGYIIPKDNKSISKVSMFKEKPDTQTAVSYIEQNALWNGGVFAFRLRYILDCAHKLIAFSDYKDLYAKYETLEKISFDYAVVERETRIDVVRFSGIWKDLGTWNTLTETMEEQSVGRVHCNENCQNTHVINELDIPILCMGMDDVVVSASPDGILVSKKADSSYIKPFVDKLDQQVMFAEKSWGSYRVLSVEENSMTIKITLKPGQKMSYHSHEHRDEVWIVVDGSGEVIIDGCRQMVAANDILQIPVKCRHTIIANTELKIIEVQIGKDINEQDKQKYKLDY